MGQPQARTHPPDRHIAKLGPRAWGWKGPGSPTGVTAHWPWGWAPRSSAGTLSVPGPSPHLVPSSMMDSLPQGTPGDTQALEQGPSAALSSGEDTPICLLGRRSPPCALTFSVCRHRPCRLVLIPGSD